MKDIDFDSIGKKLKEMVCYLSIGTIKNNKFCIVSRFTAGDIFKLLLYIDYDIPLVSSHLTFFVIVGYCSN